MKKYIIFPKNSNKKSNCFDYERASLFSEEDKIMQNYVLMEREFIEFLKKVIEVSEENELFFVESLIENLYADNNTTKEMKKVFEKVQIKYKLKESDIYSTLQLMLRHYLDGTLIGEKITIRISYNFRAIIEIEEANINKLKSAIPENIRVKKTRGRMK